ncbi:Uncharacterised protein [Streptococcus pneumoniae]|nr:Uncharacterised protein [Streptococcus pneumoniae]
MVPKVNKVFKVVMELKDQKENKVIQELQVKMENL